jgi:hypothetical protein
MEKLHSRFINFVILASLLYACTGSSRNNEYKELKEEVLAFEKKVQDSNLDNNESANSLYQDINGYETRMAKFKSSSYKPLRDKIEKLKAKLECHISGISYIRMECNSINPYDVYIDGENRWRIPPRQYLIKEIKTGEHLLGFEQVSGYVFWKTNPSIRHHFAPCDTITYSFPNE